MKPHLTPLARLATAFLVLTSVVCSYAASYVNFEGKQTNPIRVSPDGSLLFAVNTPDARVSIFDLTDPDQPTLIKEIPVGLEPVSVNPFSNEEVWVVNEISDSVSVLSISRGIVTTTLRVKDEPMDVVFAGGRAFVSVGGNNEIAVFDVNTRRELKRIPLQGLSPRALAVSPNGTKVYAAFALSGNRTTIIPREVAPDQPPPTNIPNAPPKVALIVDAENAAWADEIHYTMPDNDAVEIDVDSMAVVRYFPRLGTVNLGLGVNPANGDLWVANTDARNLVSFEPNLRGYAHFNRVTRVDIATGQATPFDLNPDVDYLVMPNLEARATALAQPTSVIFDPSGDSLYVAAFGTDRVAKLDTQGNVEQRIEISPATGATADPRNKRGPRGMALHPSGSHLYVLNRIANTIAVIDTRVGAVNSEIPTGSHDPTPNAVRVGRGFLYDARLSGNGTFSCASCHVDAEMDHLAWNLGDPGGLMQPLLVTQNGFSTTTYPAHPMKGPMVTQTLRGLKGVEPLHWRGDRASFLDFNPAFASLMGGEPLSADDMQAFQAFVETIAFPPNPNRKLNDALPETLNGGDPNAGENFFLNTPFLIPAFGVTVRCSDCHSHPTGITAAPQLRITQSTPLDIVQPAKIPHLRNLYQKTHFNNDPGAQSLAGFGFEHDGVRATLAQAHTGPRFESIQNNETIIKNLAAFLLCFDTGMVPATGFDVTLSSDNIVEASVIETWDALEQEALMNRIELVAKADFGGLLYDPASGDYRTDTTTNLVRSRDWIRDRISEGASVTLMGVPVGSGVRMGIDRDLDGFLDGIRPTIGLPDPGFIVDTSAFRFFVNGPPGMEVMLQRGNVLGVWEDWQVQTITEVPMLLADPGVSIQSQRYYRARRLGRSPWRFVSVTGNARSSLLYIFLSNAGDVIIDELKLVAGSQAGYGTNHIANGDFESVLDGPYTIPSLYAGTTINTTATLAGAGSLHIVAAGPPPNPASVIRQDFQPVVTNNLYTLSYWYLPGTNNLNLTVRLSDNSLVSRVSLSAGP